ncbi:MAG: Ig-like domain-containing protein [Mediterranea sp.]|nr:Ig-like domain-containing protein [Mediterranea sp.]
MIGMLYSCASIGRPDGGAYDETPPRLVGSTPEAGGMNIDRTRIVLEFDEFIKLEKPNEKVVISPPQVQQPEIKTSGRRITINLLDTLKANTTYTVDFSDAIVDNNEGNPLDDFTFTFSTGGQIDTLAISGVLLEASNLEPVKSVLIGLHSNPADTAFTKLPFERVSRTDSRGRFTIRGIAPGTYRLFALQDADQNFAFTQKSEAIAFHDSLIIPRFEERIRQDTMWKDTLTVDTIIERKYTHYLPDDLLLRSFKEINYSQSLVKSERLTPQKFTLYFSEKADTLPTLTGLDFDEKDAFVIEKSTGNDTIHYWVKDSLLYKQDTLKIKLEYLYTDTLKQLVPRTDTLKLSVRKARGGERDESKKKKKKEDEPEPTLFLKVTPQVPSSMDVYGHISLLFDEPLLEYDPDSIHLQMKVDTLWQDASFDFEQDTVEIRRYNLYANWEPTAEYVFSVDSTTFYGLYGLHTDKIRQNFKVRSLDDYGEIYFNVSGQGPIAFVELLDTQDKVVRRASVVEGKADFHFLGPGKYSARLINDTNGNGVWDTGDYEKGLQPEMVYYYPQIVELKALWQLEQDWDVTSVPLDKQKVDDLKKQKPDEDKKKRESRNAERNRNK